MTTKEGSLSPTTLSPARQSKTGPYILNEIIKKLQVQGAKEDPINGLFPTQIAAPRPTNVNWNERQESRDEDI